MVAAVGLVVGGVSGGHVHRVARAGVGAETLTHDHQAADAAGLPHGVQWSVAVVAYKIALTTRINPLIFMVSLIHIYVYLGQHSASFHHSPDNPNGPSNPISWLFRYISEGMLGTKDSPEGEVGLLNEPYRLDSGMTKSTLASPLYTLERDILTHSLCKHRLITLNKPT